MLKIGENALGGLGDLGNSIPSAPITFPIRCLIKRDAERAGIDTHNPRRSVARFLGSCGMATALGAFLGPPAGILGGLLGYVVATGSDYEGDRPKNARKAEEEAIYLAELEALQIAAEITESLVDRDTWNKICEGICDEIESRSAIPDRVESLDDAATMMFEIVGESIRQVDPEVYSIFKTVYIEERWELGLP